MTLMAIILRLYSAHDVCRRKQFSYCYYHIITPIMRVKSMQVFFSSWLANAAKILPKVEASSGMTPHSLLLAFIILSIFSRISHAKWISRRCYRNAFPDKESPLSGGLVTESDLVKISLISLFGRCLRRLFVRSSQLCHAWHVYRSRR